MNDETKRLLELAAKAAGIHPDSEVNHLADGAPAFWCNERGQWWRPDIDDGDSRRLEVALGMQVSVCLALKRVRATVLAPEDWEKAVAVAECAFSDDASAATRMAVLIAAADVGEAMP